MKVAGRGRECGKGRRRYEIEGLNCEAGIKIAQSEGEDLTESIACCSGTRGQNRWVIHFKSREKKEGECF